MKAILLLLLISLSATYTSAQITSADDWNRERLLREQKSMTVLTIWGNASLTVGTFGAIFSEEEDIRTFHAVNAGFGLVNTTLGVLGLERTKRDLGRTISLEDGYNQLRKTRQILLLNAGLDVGYIIAGLFLYDDGNGPLLFSPDYATRLGAGISLICQGSVLLIFDSISFFEMRKSHFNISPVFTTSGAGLGFQTNFEKERPVGVAWF